MGEVRVVVWVGEKRKDPRTARNAAEDNHAICRVKEGRAVGLFAALLGAHGGVGVEGCEVEFGGDIAEHGDEFLELVAEVKVVDDAEVDEFEGKAFWDDLVEGEREGLFEATFEDLDGDVDLDLIAEHEALFAEGVWGGGAVLAFEEDFGGAVESGVEEGDLGLTELRDAVAEGVGKGPSADEDLASDLEGIGLLLEGFFELKFFGDGFELWGLELSEAFEDGGEDDLEEEGIATPLEASFFVGIEAAEVGLSRRAGGDGFLNH